MKRPTWPSTFLEDLSPREVRRVFEVFRSYVPEEVAPSEWQILFWVLLAVVMHGS